MLFTMSTHPEQWIPNQKAIDEESVEYVVF